MSKLPQNIAISVNDVHKDFKLPHHSDDSIKHRIITAFEKKDKTVEYHHTLRGVSFEVKKGEFFGILGRNGSGKSTLLKIISEIYQPTSGSVAHKGKLVAFIELGVGFNPQLSGRDNVYLNAALLGFSRSEIDNMYDDIVSFAELEKFMDQKLKNYSSGMKVRLAFSVAIQANADILILDEVLAVGDAAFQKKCYDYFSSLKEEHKTVVLVSHSMSAIREYCDRAILIEDGVIAHEGSAEDIAGEYLKLFNKPQYEKEQAAKQAAIRDAQHRWGSGKVKFTNLKSRIDEKLITLDIEVTANENVKDVVIGGDVFDHNSRIVGGIDDAIQHKNKFSLKKGEVKKLRYSYQNILGGGDYSITIALRSIDNREIYDFWKYAVKFTNQVDIVDYFPVVFPIQIEES